MSEVRGTIADMDHSLLQSHLVTEAAALRAAALRAEPDAKVPSCPEWTATDLLDHVTEVYDHKIQCMRLLREPADEDMPVREGAAVARFDAALAELLAEFDARGPETLSFTWYGPDQSVGFWIRRMAQETAVHRADAELAAGEPIGTVDPALARDGIDEMVTVMLEWGSIAFHEYVAETLTANSDLVVAIDTGECSWTVRISPERVAVEDGVADDAQATVSGSPSEALMWLWRRTGPDALAVQGDRSSAAALHDLISEFTQ